MKKLLMLVATVMVSLAPLAAQSVKVTSPNGNESWPLKSKHAITWTFQNAGSVKVNIILRNAGGVVGTLKSRIDLSAGSWTWDPVGSLENGITVPPAAGYVIRIRDANNTFHDDSDKPFAIALAVKVVKPLPERLPPIEKLLKTPRLEVSDIDLAPNDEGFGIVFNYKNVGGGALPKASEVPVKPSYRVLIDGKETASGSLFIPAFAAAPGWEQWGYFGGWIVLPDHASAMARDWRIGNEVTVHINENKVMGMDSHSLTKELKTIALKYKYDLVRRDIALDWEKRELKLYLYLDGNVPPGREMVVRGGPKEMDSSYFLLRQPAKRQGYDIAQKVSFPSHYDKVTFYLHTYVTNPESAHVWDMDYYNNRTIKLEFIRPDPYPNSIW